MQVSNILLHIVALLSFLIRIFYLRKAIKQNEKSKIKSEILIIILIVVTWAILFWGLRYLFK